MKTLLLAGFLAACMFSAAQEPEFQTYQGLIYPESTVDKLKHIVDSLNLKFKVCESRSYFSKMQAKAHYVSVEKKNVKAALADMKNGMPYGEFITKYPKATIDEDLLVVRFDYKNHERKDVVEFSSISVNERYGHGLEFEKDLGQYNGPVKGKWIYTYYKGDKYSDESVDAFYFIEDLISVTLPEHYARLIQYSDCLIDTTATVFINEAMRDPYDEDEKSSLEDINAFLSYTELHSPDMPDYEDEDYAVKIKTWDSLRWIIMDRLASRDAKFNNLLQQAVESAVVSSVSRDEFELFVEKYHSKELALELKRKRRVMGMCSMDDRPRRHAVEIARLSAEAVKWEIFLRAHLDVMNDRFERMSDGSYAWAQRKTYIRELEVLDINVHDLLLGITLRIDNAPQNHYYGSVGRLGRALAETQKPDAIEERMMQMIADNTLDDYNRVILFFLFDNYVYNLDDAGKRATAIARLKQAAASLPVYLSGKIKIKEETYNRNR